MPGKHLSDRPGLTAAAARWVRLSGAHPLWLTMRLCTAVIDEPVDDSFLSRRTPGGAMAEAGRPVRSGAGVPTRTSDRRCRGQLGQGEGHGIRSRRTSSCRDTASCSPNRGTVRWLGAARPRAVALAAKFTVPRAVFIAASLPKTPIAKIAKSALRERVSSPPRERRDVAPPRLGWLPRRSRRPLWPASRSAAEPPQPRQRTPVDRRGGARVPARGPGASSGAVLEWPARRPDMGIGPPTAVGAAAKRSDPRDGMFRAGFSAVVAIRRGRDPITPADDGSDL